MSICSPGVFYSPTNNNGLCIIQRQWREQSLARPLLSYLPGPNCYEGARTLPASLAVTCVQYALVGKEQESCKQLCRVSGFAHFNGRKPDPNPDLINDVYARACVRACMRGVSVGRTVAG